MKSLRDLQICDFNHVCFIEFFSLGYYQIKDEELFGTLDIFLVPIKFDILFLWLFPRVCLFCIFNIQRILYLLEKRLWKVIKMIPSWFESASRLHVYFARNCVRGMNVDHTFFKVVESFLHCSVGSLLFKYMGLRVGYNPRRKDTWKLLINLISRSFGSWKPKFVTSGGRAVLINSVINFIPILY